MVKSAIKVYARMKPEKAQKNVMNYRINHRPKENLEEDFLFLVSPSLKSKDYPDNRPESWNFAFFHIFEETTTQEDVFGNVARPVVESALDGYNGTIFAYGQTASGKTYSITGEQKDHKARGIIPRSLQYLFDVIRKRPENVYSVEVAYLEIYNENGYDLLDRRQRELAVTRLEDLPRVTIQEDEVGQLHVKNLSFHHVKTLEDAFELLLIGDHNRITSETPMNAQSSRSHCIFTIVIATKKFGADQYKRAKVHLVDLAGSERVHKCSISGTILTEAKHINLSLHYLEQVIVCLGQESPGHIPYRNCLLTSLLRDSLGGNCLTTMLATLSVASHNVEETVSTCRFAQRVALIRNDARQVLEKDAQSENALLRLENERLKEQIRSMTGQLTSSEELTADDKRNLDSQIVNFLESDTNVSWDYDAKKVQYCFEAFKKTFEMNKDPNSCLKKLEYYKDMVVQRDKEISLLIDMLKKERKRKDQKAKEGSVVPDTECYLKPSEKSCATNRNYEELQLNTESSTNNASSIVESIKESSVQENGAKNEENVTVKDNTTTVNNVLRDKEGLPSHTALLRKQKRRPQIPKIVYQHQVDESVEDVSIRSQNKDFEKTRGKFEHPPTSRSVSNETRRQNLLPFNVVNLTLTDVATNKAKMNDQSITDTSELQTAQPSRKTDKKVVKCAEGKISAKKISETNRDIHSEVSIKEDSEKSNTVLQPSDITDVRRTMLQSDESDFSTPFYNKLLHFNTPKNTMKSSQNESYKKESQYLANELNSQDYKIESNVKYCQPKLHFTSLDDDTSLKLRRQKKSQNIKLTNDGNNKPENYCNNILESGNDTSRSQTRCQNERKKYDTNFVGSCLENSCVISGSARAQKEDFNREPEYSDCNKNFDDSLPLTGDPEIDEEIIAFYKAKRSGGIY